MQLLAGLQSDICYVIKTGIGFETAEITRFLNYFSSYSFTLKMVFNLKTLENFQEYVHSEVTCLYNCLNVKLLMSTSQQRSYSEQFCDYG